MASLTRCTSTKISRNIVSLFQRTRNAVATIQRTKRHFNAFWAVQSDTRKRKNTQTDTFCYSQDIVSPFQRKKNADVSNELNTKTQTTFKSFLAYSTRYS